MTRMSASLADWVHEEAQSREMDDAAFVRLVLAERMNGIGAVPQYGSSTLQLLQEATDLQVEDHEPDTDPDTLISERLAEAERAGLTRQVAPPVIAQGNGFDGPPIRALRQVNRSSGKDWMGR